MKSSVDNVTGNGSSKSTSSNSFSMARLHATPNVACPETQAGKHGENVLPAVSLDSGTHPAS